MSELEAIPENQPVFSFELVGRDYHKLVADMAIGQIGYLKENDKLVICDGEGRILIRKMPNEDIWAKTRWKAALFGATVKDIKKQLRLK